MILPSILLQEIEKRRCLLFVGAGLSINADLPPGMTMPTWSQLAEQLAEHLKQLHEHLSTVEKKPLEIISLYERILGRNILITAMAELLHVQDAKPGPVHKKLAKINEFDTIVTTNFEHLLEQSYKPEKVNVIVGDENIVRYSPHTHTNIIKIHGDFSNYQKLVITRKDYDAFHKNYPVLTTNVSAWFSTKIPLFIGYSLNDPHFIQIRDFLKGALGNFLNRWFVVRFDATKDEIEKALGDNMVIINLPTDGKTKEDALLEFLCEIQDYITTKQVGSLTSPEDPQERPREIKEVSKDNLTGRVVNAFSGLEVSLRATLEKFDHTEKHLKNRPFSFLVKSALPSGILTTSDMGEISQIQKIRNSVVHAQSQVTRKDVEYVEKLAAHFVQKLSKMETVTILPIQIELSVNKDFFQDGDTLTISGKVSKILPNLPVTVQIMGADSSLVHVSQLEVDTKGHFDNTFNTGRPLWQKSGKYTITAIYGADENKATRIINYEKTEPELTDEIQLKIDGKSHTILCLIEGGSFKGYYATLGTNVLTILTNTYVDGRLSLRIPRHLLDAKKDDGDDGFFVLVDGEEVDFYETKTVADRTLTVDFAMGSEEIMIVGTTVLGGETLQKDVVKILESSGTPRDDEKYLKPQTLIIKKGQTVTWENCDSVGHTVTSGTPEGGHNGNFDSGMFVGDSTYCKTFDKTGTYRYFCIVHPWKEGKIIVTE